MKITNPRTNLLVKAVVVGDKNAEIIGYYHYDSMSREGHFVCDQHTLKKYAVHVASIEIAHPEETILK